jgi:Zn-dependent protease with chaperone function
LTNSFDIDFVSITLTVLDIASGDSVTSLHLAAINMGFYAVLRLGYSMYNRAKRGDQRSRGNERTPESARAVAVALMVAGGATWILGQLFSLFVSRSRELIADACSVAYVGNNKVV